MIDYTNFIIALKSSWIRRLIIAKNSKWKTLFETEFGISIADVLKFGSNYIELLKHKTNNKFWTDTLQSWIDISNADKCNLKNIASDHLWYNPELKMDELQIPYKEFCKDNIIHFGDLCDMDNSLMSYAKFKEMSTGNVNFLQFSGLIATIKKYMQQNNKIIVKDFNIRYPSTISLIFQSKKRM